MSSKPTVTELLEVEVHVAGDIVTVFPTGKRGRHKEVPIGVLCAASEIRNAMSFMTGHVAISRAIWTWPDKKFLCMAVYPSVLPRSEHNPDYLRKVGYAAEGQMFDWPDYFKGLAQNGFMHVQHVKTWRWKRIKDGYKRTVPRTSRRKNSISKKRLRARLSKSRRK